MATNSSYTELARRTARSITDAPPYTTRPPRPNLLTRAVVAVGHFILWLVRHASSLFRRWFAHPLWSGVHRVFGGWTPVIIVTGSLVLGVVVGVLTLTYRRRTRPAAGSPRARTASEARHREFLREAERARAAGDRDHAVRLRFEAGLEKLESRGVLENRTVLTTRDISDRLSSPTFDELALVHARVTYAQRPASEHDVDDAFASWPTVESVDPVVS